MYFHWKSIAQWPARSASTETHAVFSRCAAKEVQPESTNDTNGCNTNLYMLLEYYVLVLTEYVSAKFDDPVCVVPRGRSHKPKERSTGVAYNRHLHAEI